MLAVVVLLLVSGAAVIFATNSQSPEPSQELAVNEERLGGDRDEHGCIPSAGYSWCEARAECLRVWETPCVTDEDLEEIEPLAAQIKTAIVAKHGTGAQSLDISVAEINGSYARGGASEAGMGGGMWFAARVGDNWELVWDGNGVIMCDDIDPYPGFPTNMVPECYDEATGEMVQR